MTKPTLLGFLLALAAIPATVSFAKEIGSGGNGGTVVGAACSPVGTLTAKGDGRAGETGLGSVLVNWGVKPCDRSRSVRVSFTLINFTTKAFIYTDSNAPANGRVDLLVPSRQLYQGIVTVFDAVTGEVVGTRSITVSTVPKGGV